MKGFLALAFSSLLLVLASPLTSQAQQSRFEDSVFDTGSKSSSPWFLAGLDVISGMPSCLTLPDEEPELQVPVPGNQCLQSTALSSDGDDRSLRLQVEIRRSPFRGVIGTVVDEELGYLPMGTRFKVDMRFAFAYDFANSGTPSNGVVARALILQRDANGRARFYVSGSDKQISLVVGFNVGFFVYQKELVWEDFSELTGPGFASVDPLSQPDISDGAAPIRFGFALDVGYNLPLGGPPGTPFTVRRFFVDEFLFVVDTDFDGVADFQDNCSLDPNIDQIDADQDGFGNLCDADCTQDGIVGLPDYIAISRCRAGSCACDLTGDGERNFGDFLLLSTRWGKVVGPSGMAPEPAP